MKKIPMKAKDQLLLAAEHGHVLRIETRDAVPERNEPFKRYWLRCSCGYESTARRSRVAVSNTMAWHLGDVLSDVLLGDSEKRANGVPDRPTPSEREGLPASGARLPPRPAGA